jgi:hypothetical protein
VHVCYHSTKEAEAGGWQVRGHLGLHSETNKQINKEQKTKQQITKGYKRGNGSIQ